MNKITRNGQILDSAFIIKRKLQVYSNNNPVPVFDQKMDPIFLTPQLIDLDFVVDYKPEILSNFNTLNVSNIRFENDICAFDIENYTFVISRHNYGKMYEYFKQHNLGTEIFLNVFNKHK